MDFDAAWVAWEAAGHDTCSGFRYEPGYNSVRCCDCLTVIPVPEGGDGGA